MSLSRNGKYEIRIIFLLSSSRARFIASLRADMNNMKGRKVRYEGANALYSKAKGL